MGIFIYDWYHFDWTKHFQSQSLIHFTPKPQCTYNGLCHKVVYNVNSAAQDKTVAYTCRYLDVSPSLSSKPFVLALFTMETRIGVNSPSNASKPCQNIWWLQICKKGICSYNQSHITITTIIRGMARFGNFFSHLYRTDNSCGFPDACLNNMYLQWKCLRQTPPPTLEAICAKLAWHFCCWVFQMDLSISELWSIHFLLIR